MAAPETKWFSEIAKKYGPQGQPPYEKGRGYEGELRAKTPEERRKNNLLIGTNWQPRTYPKKTKPGWNPFRFDQEGYLFFQGYSPKTAYAQNLPSVFSKFTIDGIFDRIKADPKGPVFIGLFLFL